MSPAGTRASCLQPETHPPEPCPLRSLCSRAGSPDRRRRRPLRHRQRRHQSAVMMHATWGGAVECSTTCSELKSACGWRRCSRHITIRGVQTHRAGVQSMLPNGLYWKGLHTPAPLSCRKNSSPHGYRLAGSQTTVMRLLGIRAAVVLQDV